MEEARTGARISMYLLYFLKVYGAPILRTIEIFFIDIIVFYIHIYHSFHDKLLSYPFFLKKNINNNISSIFNNNML